MPKAKNNKSKTKSKKASTANLGFEQKLWLAADKLRSSMDASEYKHVVLGLIFLKYISDTFEKHREKLSKGASDPDSEYYIPNESQRDNILEDRDFYTSENVFWVPKEARWDYFLKNAKRPEIGKLIDDGMIAIEKKNPKQLKGVLPKNYARPEVNKQRLGELIDLIGSITVVDSSSNGKDLLGRVYEYFLGRFASAEGKGGGEFYTPSCVVRTLVEMIEPYKGRVYDPCCGSGGMFVQSEKFVESHDGKKGDIAIFGQEMNPTTWRLCRMNLAIRGIEGDLGPQWDDTFHKDVHPDLKADFVLANPPFNISDWGGQRLKEDKRWKYGVPPTGNANFGWVQHIIHHLSLAGVAGFVLANGSLSSNSGGEGEIRRKLVEANLVDCIIAMPGQLFYQTPISVSLWFLSRDRQNGMFRDRRGEVLFIDARELGYLIDRVHRELGDADITKIANTYHSWRGEAGVGKYENVPGFCKAAKLEEIKSQGFVLTPGRFVGVEKQKDDSMPFEEKMETLKTQLKDQFVESTKFQKTILEILESISK